jgi:hypothetical protein
MAYFGTVARDAKGRIGCRKPDGTFLAGMNGGLAEFRVSFGGLYPYDIDKRIYRNHGHFQMENAEQLARRLAASQVA